MAVDVALEPVAGAAAVSQASNASAWSETGRATVARHWIVREALRTK